MSGFLETAFGPGAGAAQIAIVAGVLVAVFMLAAWLFRRRGGAPLEAAASRPSRLGVTDAAVVDRRRRLLLVRRDNVEHLVMIGGPADIVVEANIGRPRQRAGVDRHPAAAPAEMSQRIDADPGDRLAERAALAARAAQPQAAQAKDRLNWIAAHRPMLSEDDLTDDIMAEIDAADTAPPPGSGGRRARPGPAEAAEPKVPPRQAEAERDQEQAPARTAQSAKAGNASAVGLTAGVAALTAAVKMGRNAPPDGSDQPPEGERHAPRRGEAAPAQARETRAPANDSSGGPAGPRRPRDADRAPQPVPDVIGEMRKAFGLRGRQPAAGNSGGPPSPPAAKAQGDRREQPADHAAARASARQDHAQEATGKGPLPARGGTAAAPDPFAALDDVEPSEAALLRERLRQEGRRPSSGAISAAGTITTLGDLAERLEEALAKQATGTRSKGAGTQAARHHPPAGDAAAETIPAKANGESTPRAEPEQPDEAEDDPSVIDFAGRRKTGGESLEDEMARLLGELTGDGGR